MKIVYDSQIFCAQKYGGVSRYFCEIAPRISKLNKVSVDIVAPMYICKYLERISGDLISGFKAPVHGKLHRVQRALGIVAGDLMLRTRNIDILHETYYSPYKLGPSSVKRVLTIYDMIHEKFQSGFHVSDRTSQYKANAAKRADHVICISESTRRDVVEILKVPSEKTSVVHLGFDLMLEPGTAESNPYVEERLPYLLYVGQRGGYKNFMRLIDAMGSSKIIREQFNLVCFGGGDFTATERLAMDTKNFRTSQVSQISGSDGLLSTLYKQASMLIYPSLYEGFGIPPLEAMAHGCPVVCSDTSSMPEVVGNAAVYFDPNSVESLIAALESLASSDSLRRELTEKGRARLPFFSWDQCATSTHLIYQKLL
jgi:glycosyltransferase involved in cell wall biosynthesis